MMKRFIIGLILLFVSTNISAQILHKLQVDNGGSVSTILGSNPGATFTLPAGPGSISLTTGTGTQNLLAKWNNAAGTSLGNSMISDDGNSIGMGGVSAMFSLVHIRSTTNQFALSVEAQDVIGGSLPLLVYGNTTGQVFGGNTYGRLIRLGDSRTNDFYDMGIDGNNAFFLMDMNSTSQVLTLRGGKIGIGETNPVALLSVGSGNKLQVDASGNLNTFGYVDALSDVITEFGNLRALTGGLQLNGTMRITSAGDAILSTATIGGGTAIQKEFTATFLLNAGPYNIAAGGARNFTLTGGALAGLNTTDAVIAEFDDAIYANNFCVISASVIAANQVIVNVYNGSGGAVNDAGPFNIRLTVIHQ